MMRLGLGLLLLALSCGRPAVPQATLRLMLVDAATGRPTPARVELLNGRGGAVTPVEAMPNGVAVSCPSNTYMHTAAVARDIEEYLARLTAETES